MTINLKVTSSGFKINDTQITTTDFRLASEKVKMAWNQIPDIAISVDTDREEWVESNVFSTEINSFFRELFLYGKINKEEATKLVDGILNADATKEDLAEILKDTFDKPNVQDALNNVLKSSELEDKAKKVILLQGALEAGIPESVLTSILKDNLKLSTVKDALKQIVAEKFSECSTYQDLAKDRLFTVLVKNGFIKDNFDNITNYSTATTPSSDDVNLNKEKLIKAYFNSKSETEITNKKQFYRKCELYLNNFYRTTKTSEFSQALLNINENILIDLSEKEPTELSLDQKLERIREYLNHIENKGLSSIENLTSVMVNMIPDDILKIPSENFEKIQNISTNKDTKKLINELVFGKYTGPGNTKQTPLIKPEDVDDFIQFLSSEDSESLTCGKNGKSLCDIKYDIHDTVDTELSKAYIVSRFYEHKEIKLDRQNKVKRIPTTKDGVDGTYWLGRRLKFSKDWHSFYYYSNTIENNEKFLDSFYDEAKKLEFQGLSERKVNGAKKNADEHALSAMMLEYANCYSQADKAMYRKSFDYIIELLKTKSGPDATTTSSGPDTTTTSIRIPCSPDQFRLLVHARMKESRTGWYNINAVRNILSDEKLPIEQKTAKIREYCENQQTTLLGYQNDNQGILQKNSYWDASFYSGCIGGTFRMAFNNTIGCIGKASSCISYNCFTSHPSSTIRGANSIALIPTIKQQTQ